MIQVFNQHPCKGLFSYPSYHASIEWPWCSKDSEHEKQVFVDNNAAEVMDRTGDIAGGMGHMRNCTYNDVRAPRPSKSPAGSETNPFDPRRLEASIDEA